MRVSFRYLLRALASGATLSLLLGSPANAGYFPSRPSGAQLQTVTGVLIDYGIGNGTGSFDLRDASGNDHWIHIGSQMTINGVTVKCLNPDPKMADFGKCPDWPSTVVVGTTVVTATCWTDTSWRPGLGPVLFSDQIDIGTQAQIRARRRRG